MIITVVLVSFVAVTSALPHEQVVSKLDDGVRHQYIQGPDGSVHLVDMWLKDSNLAEAARYLPETQNAYHLFTRLNPALSQPLIVGGDNILANSNFNSTRRTVILIHGWMDSVTSEFNAVLVRDYLEGEDVNVIIVDWFAGAGTINYATAVINTPLSGEAVAKFITWLTQASGATLDMFHIIGHGLGGHQAGIVGRNLDSQVGYITALDPSFGGWVTNTNKFQPNDAAYTEVIHTNAGLQGYLATLGQVDFYPNGGVDMPGCITQDCDHARSFYYMGESLKTGGFTGTRCASYITAMTGNCLLWGNLQMGGRMPKTGSTGIFHLRTNIFPPFSRF